MQQDVKFIRNNGKIIPIKQKGDSSAVSYLADRRKKKQKK